MNATQLISRLTQTSAKNTHTQTRQKLNNTVKATVLAKVRRWQLSVRVRCWKCGKFCRRCVEADVIVITQAANTGLTGGSTPDGNDYDRDIVIVNTMRLNIIQPINNNEQVSACPVLP